MCSCSRICVFSVQFCVYATHSPTVAPNRIRSRQEMSHCYVDAACLHFSFDSLKPFTCPTCDQELVASIGHIREDRIAHVYSAKCIVRQRHERCIDTYLCLDAHWTSMVVGTIDRDNCRLLLAKRCFQSCKQSFTSASHKLSLPNSAAQNRVCACSGQANVLCRNCNKTTNQAW